MIQTKVTDSVQDTTFPDVLINNSDSLYINWPVKPGA